MSTDISSEINTHVTQKFSKKQVYLINSISTVIAEIEENLNSPRNSDLSAVSPEKLSRMESWRESAEELKEMLKCFPFIREGSVKTLHLRDNLEKRTTNDWVIDKNTLSKDYWDRVFYISSYYFKDEHLIANMVYTGFNADVAPEGYASGINFSDYVSKNKEVVEFQRKTDILGSTDNNAVKRPQNRFGRIPSPVVIGTIGISSISMLTGGVIGSLPMLLGSAALMIFSMMIHTESFGTRKDEYSVKGEVVSTKVHPLPEIGSNVLETIKAFMSSINNKVEPSINEKIRVSFEAAKKLHENEYLDAQTRADIDSLITSKLIPSVETYMQANSFAPTAQDSAWVEDNFRDQLKDIDLEVERLNEAIFKQRKEQMQIQSMYLSSAKRPDALNLDQ